MDLFDKYSKGLISREELKKWADNMDSMSDNELYQIMSDKWMNFSAPKSLSKTKKNSIYPFRRRSARLVTMIMSIAASVVLAITGISFWNQNKTARMIDSMASKVTVFNAYSIGASEVVLPDGTSVILNSNSKLTYSGSFGLKDRKVTLEGQGYFDVQKNPDKEFVITSQNMEITVRGTKFNVYSYPAMDVMEVSLVSGAISLDYDRYHHDIIPNEKVVINKKTGTVKKEKTDNQSETFWMKGDLVFENAPLSDVFDKIERKFGVTIKVLCDLDLSDCYTGTFSANNLSMIFDVLKMHYEFKYSFSGDKTTVYLK